MNGIFRRHGRVGTVRADQVTHPGWLKGSPSRRCSSATRPPAAPLRPSILFTVVISTVSGLRSFTEPLILLIVVVGR